MDVDFIAVLDRIEDFKLSTATHEKWESWLRQFNIVLRARAFDNLPNSRRVALLLTKCKGFIDVLNVLNINEETVEYDELVSQLTQYLKPINARHAFLNRTQGDDESFDNYAEALVSLSHPCRFLDSKVVRDVYVANLNVKHDKVKKLILSKVDPSLEDAIALSNAMVFQGCVESTHQQDIDYSPNMPLNNEFVPTKYNVRMMPCTSGVHEVHVINIANGMVFVCPKPMVHSRTKILNEFNNDMRNCNESQVMPNKVHIGGLYAALVNAKWYRVRVLAEQQKKVDIVSIDFGWMKTIPFSVLRNLPLDYRVINELVWSLMWYNDSIPDSLQANQTTVIKVFQCNNVWQADLPRERRSLSPSAMTSDFRNVRISRQTTDGGIPQRRSLGQEKPTSYENTRGNRGSYRKSSSDTTSCDTDRESVKGAELSNGHARESKQSGRSSRQQCFQQPKQNYDSDSMEDSNCYQKSQRVTQKIRPEGSSKAHFIPHSVEMNGAASSLSRNGQLANDRLKVVSLGCPIPLNRYTKVEVSYKSNKGVLYCYRVDCKDKLMALSAELYNLQESGLPSITNPQKGDLCLAFDDGCLLRAKIVSIHTSTQRAKLSFIDSGHYEKKPISELQELPEKFQDVPGFVFPIQVNTEAQIEQYEEIEVKPVRQNEDGSWVMEVNNSHVKPKAGSQSNPSSTQQIAERRSPLEDVPRQSTNQQGGVKQALKPSADKTRVADPPRRPRPPPIPRSQFSEVMVVWDGPEGTFALDATKTKTLLDVQDALNTCDLRRLSGPAEVDGLYVAPFEGENFRARVIEFTKNKKSCLVTFVDYGNEGELPIEDLRCLPDQIRDVPVYTFKFQFAMADSKPQVEEIYEVTPVVLQADGSWLVQLKGEPTSSEFALPDDEDIGPFQR